MKEGWICPKCGRVLAPFIAECPCYRATNQQQSNITFVRDTMVNPNYADRPLVKNNDGSVNQYE